MPQEGKDVETTNDEGGEIRTSTKKQIQPTRGGSRGLVPKTTPNPDEARAEARILKLQRGGDGRKGEA
jgi:hypothetical protein